jgi:hypothetical protein
VWGLMHLEGSMTSRAAMSARRPLALLVTALLMAGSFAVIGSVVPLRKAVAATPPAVTVPTGFTDQAVLALPDDAPGDPGQPSNIQFAPDGRVFVATKQGKIWVYDSLSDTAPKLFADLDFEVFDQGDRGILGLALDPNFGPARPYVYIQYTLDQRPGDPAIPRYNDFGCAIFTGGCVVDARI